MNRPLRHLAAVFILSQLTLSVLAGTISGTVAGPDGEPIAGAEVGLMAGGQAPSRPLARTRTDAHGRFSIPNVVAGDYQLHARMPNRAATSPITLAADEHLDVPVVLQPSARPRYGREGETITGAAGGEWHVSRLRAGEAAPEFSLPTPDRESEISLASFRDRKPVVLVFGSYTCPPFRDRMLQVEQLHQAWKDRAQFIMVYIREAHPDSVLYVEEDGKQVLRKISQTQDLESRSQNAQVCALSLKLSFPAVVDRQDNKINAAYGGWPSRIVVVDTGGRIAFDGGQGPAGFQPEKLQQWLKANVGE